MDDDKAVVFDAHGAIRIYEPEKFDELCKTLESEANYVQKMDQFSSVVSQTMSITEQLGDAIEKEKLRAIGSRNVVESEGDARKKALSEAEFRLGEKQAELDRYIAEYQSLMKVQQEQQNVIHRLSQASD